MFMEMQFAKSLVALLAAGCLWIADTVIPDIAGVPQWVSTLGVPVCFLIAVIYALVYTHRSYLRAIERELKDKDAIISMLDGFHKRDIESRERLTVTMQHLIETNEKLLTSGEYMARLVAACPAAAAVRQLSHEQNHP